MCRTGFLHYHRQELEREMHCDACKFPITIGYAWLRCQDSRPMCDECYFEHGEEEEQRQHELDRWRAIRNRQAKRVWP